MSSNPWVSSVLLLLDNRVWQDRLTWQIMWFGELLQWVVSIWWTEWMLSQISDSRGSIWEILDQQKTKVGNIWQGTIQGPEFEIWNTPIRASVQPVNTGMKERLSQFWKDLTWIFEIPHQQTWNFRTRTLQNFKNYWNPTNSLRERAILR